jgi:hypothetical protein
MKKLIFGAMVLLTSFAFTSCRKDYSCVCRFNGATVWTQQYDNISRADAEDRCDGDATAASGAVNWDCDVELD